MRGRLIAWLVLTGLHLPAAAEAQTALAGRVVRDSYAPGPQAARPALDLGSFSGETPPAGADIVPLEVSGVRFEGDPCPVPAACQLLAAAVGEGGRTVADLFASVHAMETAFAEAGFVLTRATIPPQNVVPGGPIAVGIVNGHIETIDVSALPERIRAPVLGRLAPLLSLPVIRRADIERALLNAGDFGGLALRSTFAPGDEPGGTKLIVDGSFQPINGSIGIGNGASEAVGGWENTASISLNSPFGFGEQLYLSYQSDPQMAFGQGRMRILAAGALVPLGNDGLTVSPELVWARIVPEPEAGVPDSRNDMARASLRFTYPLVRLVERTVIAHAEVEAVNQRVEATEFATTLSADAYLALRGDVEFQSLPSPDLTLFGSVTLSQGLGGIGSVFDGVADVPSTHPGATPDFTKGNITAGATKTGGRVVVSALLRAQTSFGQPLFNSEQFSLDGIDALSSLSPGVYAVDQGATLRTEVGGSFPVGGAFSTIATPYVFGAIGAGQTFDTTAAESATTRAGGIGAGVRAELWQSEDQTGSLSLGFEIGHSWIDAGTKTETSKVGLTLGWNF